jgi:hypothetical protein
MKKLLVKNSKVLDEDGLQIHNPPRSSGVKYSFLDLDVALKIVLRDEMTSPSLGHGKNPLPALPPYFPSNFVEVKESLPPLPNVPLMDKSPTRDSPIMSSS